MKSSPRNLALISHTPVVRPRCPFSALYSYAELWEVDGGASAGYGDFSGGVFGAENQNACGWDAGIAWTPTIGLGPPVGIHGGVGYTWAAPAW